MPWPLAVQLLGAGTVPWFEARDPQAAALRAATPWHQDEAHRNDPGTEYEQLSIWMPLQEATRENGCMRYIAGSHEGPVLEHRSPNNDPRITALECIGLFAPDSATLCPLPPGGAALHHCRTLHSAGPNQSDTRAALTFSLSRAGASRSELTGYPWNATKRTAAQERQQAWRIAGCRGRAGRRAASALARRFVPSAGGRADVA